MISGLSTSGGTTSATARRRRFNIQTPVAIAIGVRAPKPSSDAPAKVRYAKIKGQRGRTSLRNWKPSPDSTDRVARLP